jgi:hypothetical protein
MPESLTAQLRWASQRLDALLLSVTISPPLDVLLPANVYAALVQHLTLGAHHLQRAPCAPSLREGLAAVGHAQRELRAAIAILEEWSHAP